MSDVRRILVVDMEVLREVAGVVDVDVRDVLPYLDKEDAIRNPTGGFHEVGIYECQAGHRFTGFARRTRTCPECRRKP